MEPDGNLVWIDLEMSGLDPTENVILEIATVVTDPLLDIIAEGPNLVIDQPESVLQSMDEWNTKHHRQSGLTRRVRDSDVSLEEAEERTLAFVREHVEPDSSPLCGNTIGQDRRFLARYMPDLIGHLHYRNIDVSSIKELVRRWYGDELDPPSKESSHRALDDIHGSIRELKFYREHAFVEF
ncbi:MAG: oligoribonuclease [Bradymonadaceae bacterium]